MMMASMGKLTKTILSGRVFLGVAGLVTGAGCTGLGTGLENVLEILPSISCVECAEASRAAILEFSKFTLDLNSLEIISSCSTESFYLIAVTEISSSQFLATTASCKSTELMVSALVGDEL